MTHPVASLDLNLLTVFVQIYQDRKVSLAAENLGLSQPAVSNALARLRLLLNDPVFVRTARGMAPTPLADQLAIPISNALASIRETLSSQIRFDASTSHRSFVLAMTDIGEFHFLPPMVRYLERHAPGISLATVRNTAINLRYELEVGNVDIAIGHLPDLVNDFHRRVLFRQRYVCLFRKGHPLDYSSPSVADYEASEHAVVVSAGTGHGRADELISQAGIHRRIRVRVPHFVALADVLENSDLVATVPELFAIRSVRRFALAYSPHPVTLPAIEIGMFWHTKFHRDPGNQWLRQQLVEQLVYPSEPVDHGIHATAST